MSRKPSSRDRKNFVKLLELVGPKNLAARTGIAASWFYAVRYDIERGRYSGQQAIERYAGQLYDAVGEHIQELQRLRRWLRRWFKPEENGK